MNEIIKFKKIPWRITANGKLSKQDQVGGLSFGLTDSFPDLSDVRFKVANMIVKLSDLNFHLAGIRKKGQKMTPIFKERPL